MTISIAPLAVLFDADGVLQHPPVRWQADLAAIAGAADRRDAFLQELFAAEAPCLLGREDFAQALGALLARWGKAGALADALAVWTQVRVDEHALALVDELRAANVRCYLTTNQHPLRARHMSQVLGYRARFDREFYSCELGLAKPSRDYFAAVLEAIVLPPSRVLFIDDHPANVAAARELGMQAALFEPDAGAEMLHCCLQSFGLCEARASVRRPL